MFSNLTKIVIKFKSINQNIFISHALDLELEIGLIL